MYKRFSIVNQAQLVKLLEKKGLHEYGGLQELLRFLYEIQLLALLGETNYKGAALDQDGSMERFFSGDTKEHKKLTAAGLEPIMPLEDHPWGDRGFAIQDPNGVTLYIYSEIEPSEEFKQYYK